MKPEEFANIIRNVQRNHQIFSVGGNMWNIQVADGNTFINTNWEGVIDFSEKAKEIPHDSEKVRIFNEEHFPAPVRQTYNSGYHLIGSR